MAKKLSENSTIVIHLNIKTMLYILGVLISVYSVGFYFLNNKLIDVNKSVDQLKKEDIEILKTSMNRTEGQLQILIKYVDKKTK